MNNDPLLTRWRLVLGKYSQNQLPSQLNRDGKRMERALDFLYGREYEGRGVRGRDSRIGDEKGKGSLDPSQLSVPQWLDEVRELFPRETLEVVEKHALERYELTDLINDPATLEKLEPNQDLLKTMLTFKGQMKGEALNMARKLIRQIVEELRDKLAKEVRQSFSGRINRFRSSPLKVSQNFDWKKTLRANLKNWQPEEQTVILEQLKFFSRQSRQIPWDIVLCLDQSGSMTDSVIHSAVLAGLLAGLPSVNVKLVVFDTSVVDLTQYVDDPVEILMSVQLGGGTDIGKAVSYCEKQIERPSRTVFTLISDFYEGAPPNTLLSAVKRLQESGVTLIGLAALDNEALPFYDEKMAQNLTSLGMEITASTPKQFAQWLAQKIS